MKALFTVSQTFDEVTPESAEIGDFSDSGFEIEETTDYRLTDLINLINEQGVQHIQINGESMSIYGNNFTECYKTATEKTLTVHVKAKVRNIKRIEYIINKAKGE